MSEGNNRALSVIIYSSENPAATFLTAGLLQGRTNDFSTILIQGLDSTTPGPEVARVLEETGLSLRDWVPHVVSDMATISADLGLTICVPT